MRQAVEVIAYLYISALLVIITINVGMAIKVAHLTRKPTKEKSRCRN